MEPKQEVFERYQTPTYFILHFTIGLREAI